LDIFEITRYPAACRSFRHAGPGTVVTVGRRDNDVDSDASFIGGRTLSSTGRPVETWSSTTFHRKLRSDPFLFGPTPSVPTWNAK
jgi:hypothetical protein